jgi:hypothetical protein
MELGSQILVYTDDSFNSVKENTQDLLKSIEDRLE